MLKKTVILKKILASVILFSSCILYAEELGMQTKKVDVENISLRWDDIDATELVFYVENAPPSSLTTEKSLGTKEKPFLSIEDALSYISLLNKTKKKLKVCLNVKGEFSSTHSYIILCPLKILGLDRNGDKKEVSSIEFNKNAGFILTSSFLAIENVYISRKELIGEPRTVPIFYSLNARLSLKDVSINAKEGGSIFMLYNSQFSMQNISINSMQNGYCNILEGTSSTGTIIASNITCSSRSIIAIDIDKSRIRLENIHFDATSSYFNLFTRAFDSNLLIKNSNVLAQGNGKKDVAVICNNKTEFQSENLKIEGFSSEKTIKNTKTGYMEL